MGFEIPVDVDYFAHPKTLKLIAVLDRAEADIYPLRLWRWAASYARDGRLPGDVRQIEAAIGWRGRSGRLHSALVEAEFIEKDGFTLHSWGDHIGRAIAIYEGKKRKQREKYERSSGILPEESRQNSPNPGNSGYSGYSTLPSAAPEGVIATLSEALKGSNGKATGSNKPSEVDYFLARVWGAGTGEQVNLELHAEKCRAARARGISPQDIEQAFQNHTAIAGQKIWDVIKSIEGSRQDEEFRKRRDASGPRKIS